MVPSYVKHVYTIMLNTIISPKKFINRAATLSIRLGSGQVALGELGYATCVTVKIISYIYIYTVTPYIMYSGSIEDVYI